MRSVIPGAFVVFALGGAVAASAGLFLDLARERSATAEELATSSERLGETLKTLEAVELAKRELARENADLASKLSREQDFHKRANDFQARYRAWYQRKWEARQPVVTVIPGPPSPLIVE